MTTTVDRPIRLPETATPPPALPNDPLARCHAAALEAADAADLLGLDSGPLRSAHAAGVQRSGFPGDAYVLALVGGTGVGKSSLLNALAGGVVSPASARRPTTSEPIAWIPSGEREALEPLLDWLGRRGDPRARTVGIGPVAILDLPDMDSVATEHRARVEALLPLVDAVAWVTDPEKYADAVLHDEFLRSWLPRLGRQVVLVNKSDRLSPDDARRIQRDLEADLAYEAIHGSDLAVLRSSAVSSGGADDFRAWLADGAEAKRVVRERVAASLSAAARDLAWAAGDGHASSGRPLLDGASREAAVRSATDAVLRVVDLPALERQAVAATRASARSRGAGPLGRLTSFIYRTSGRQTAVADPTRFLLRWRERGGLGPAVESIRGAISAPVRDAPPAIRPAIAATLHQGEVRVGLERAVDRAVGGVGVLQAPTSRWWTVFGLLHTLATAAIVLSAAWVVVWILVRPATGSVVLPVLGPSPRPSWHSSCRCSPAT
jgi:GTP-binding protein EngB required for normal cell division